MQEDISFRAKFFIEKLRTFHIGKAKNPKYAKVFNRHTYADLVKFENIARDGIKHFFDEKPESIDFNKLVEKILETLKAEAGEQFRKLNDF